jgi:hypothetical protein
MSCFVSSIPRDVLHFLADYLLPVEEQQKQVFKYSYDLRNFVNTSKKYFGEWKKKTRLMVLTTDEAEMYASSATFRSKVLTMIEDPLEQLELQFLYQKRTNEVSFNFCGGARKIIAERCIITKFPLSCHDIEIRNCNPGALQECPPVRKFKLLSPCAALRHADLSYLAILEEAVFSSTHQKTLHSLQGLQSLKLLHCDMVTDVSCLRNIPKLEFRRCCNITDISALADARELSFLYCTRITDASSLGRVEKLEFLISNIRDVSALGNVKQLRLSCCFKINDISALKNVREIRLQQFEGTDVSGLENVEKLFLSGCDGITDISMLKNVQVLDVEACPGIVSSQLSGLEKLRNLRFCETENFNSEPFDFSILERLTTFNSTGMDFSTMVPSISLYRLHELTLHRAINSSTLLANPTLSHLRSLTLLNCQEDLTFLPEFPSLGYLTIEYCNQILALVVPGEASNFPIYSVSISSCRILEEITTIRKISEMKISDCDQLCQLDAQHQVGCLKTRSCPRLNFGGDTTKNIFSFQNITDPYR